MTHVKGKDKNQILGNLIWTGMPGSPVHEQQKMWIFVRCTEDLENVIKESSESSNSLWIKIFYLNVILTIATIIWAIATFYIAFWNNLS